MTGPGLAVFDVDGTLVAGDLLAPLVRAALRRRPARAALVAAALPAIAWHRAAGRPGAAKELLLRAALGGLDAGVAAGLGAAVAARAPLHAEVAAALAGHRARGDAVWLASAQVEPVIAPLARRLRADGHVATALQARAGRLTGRYAQGNCRGEAKVAALAAAVGRDRLAGACAYADSPADLPLMRAVARARWVRRGRISPGAHG